MNARGSSHAARADDEIANGPFDAFRQPDVLKRLAGHPDTRQYCADAGFIKSIEFLQTAKTQAETRHYARAWSVVTGSS